MRTNSFTGKCFRRTAAAVLLLLMLVAGAAAQYRGAPVKRERLLKALRSKLLQTRDIVAVITTNGVDFELTDETRRALIAAGARPEVIRAVSDNFRLEAVETTAKTDALPTPVAPQPQPPDYDDLIDQAMYVYREEKNSKTAIEFLQTAAKLQPKKPAAYQLLGFVNLYGIGDPKAAETLMREAFNHGGSAVFRVFHDDGDSFNERCAGSLFISGDDVRFESDDNKHTFEVAIGGIDKLRLDTDTNRDWRKFPVLKLFLKFGQEKTKFRFTPITGNGIETAMAERFVYVAKNNLNFTGE